MPISTTHQPTPASSVRRSVPAFVLGLAMPCLALFSLAGCAGHSPYASWAPREIKALSASDLDNLRAGRGMGFALAAELNGYPGPLHVLQLSEQLGLAPSQKQATEALFKRMQASALAAGDDFVAAERALDRLFADRRATEPQLNEALSRVAQAQAKLRGVHLQAHLEQVNILTPHQVTQYNRLRGYGG